MWYYYPVYFHFYCQVIFTFILFLFTLYSFLLRMITRPELCAFDVGQKTHFYQRQQNSILNRTRSRLDLVLNKRDSVEETGERWYSKTCCLTNPDKREVSPDSLKCRLTVLSLVPPWGVYGTCKNHLCNHTSTTRSFFAGGNRQTLLD